MGDMTEIISFPQRMRFTAIRTYDVTRGVTHVVAVLFAPERPTHVAPMGPGPGQCPPQAERSWAAHRPEDVTAQLVP